VTASRNAKVCERTFYVVVFTGYTSLWKNLSTVVNNCCSELTVYYTIGLGENARNGRKCSIIELEDTAIL